MFGDGSTLNNALMSAIATTNFSDLFAAAAGMGAGTGVAPPPALANLYTTALLSSSAHSASTARSLSSAEQIFEQLAQRHQQQKQHVSLANAQQQQMQQRKESQQQQYRQHQQNELRLKSVEAYSQCQSQASEPRLDSAKCADFLLSPPPSYSETIAMNSLARPMSAATSTTISATMSPDIVRLAADTTAVTLRDKYDDTALSVPSAFVRPMSTSMSSAPIDVTTVDQCSSAKENQQASTSSQLMTRAHGTDEPLDLSVKKNQKAFARNLIGPCASSPSPSNSSISSFDSNSNASTPSKSSLMHNNYGPRVGEVKRSASSVTHRNTGGTDFDADVAEHFRRSLSGKWPRRQLNYAHYISPVSASGGGSGTKLGGAKSLNASSSSLSNGAAGSGMSSSTARLPDRFPSINELRATTVPPATVTSSILNGNDESATNLQKIFAEKFENNVFARKNSLTARYLPQKMTQNFNGLAPSSKVIWRKKSNASCHSNTTSEYGNGSNASNFATPCASPHTSLNNNASASNCSTESPRHSAGNVASIGSGAKKAVNKNSIIIINQAQNVEDHFRMSLGDKTFEQLKRAQNRTPKICQGSHPRDKTDESVGSTTAISPESPFNFTVHGSGSACNSVTLAGNVTATDRLTSSTRL